MPGAVIAVGMVLYRRAWGKHRQQFGHILSEILTIRDPNVLATIGRKAAVADFGHLRFAGFTAWVLWSLLHVGVLIGFRNRMTVMLDWAWSYFTYGRGVRLITGPDAS